MTWAEALEAIVTQTGHQRYRDVCADSHPDHEVWRARMVEQATGEAPTYPPLATQAATAVGAAARFVTSGGARVDQSEFNRRKAICHECEFYVVVDDRCLKCGCHLNIKPWLVREHCPLNFW